MRKSGQLSGESGVYFVAHELTKRGFQIFLPFSATNKNWDGVAIHEDVGDPIKIQVKSLSRKNGFPLSVHKVDSTAMYFFVLLNEVGEKPDCFIISGKELIERHLDIFTSDKLFEGEELKKSIESGGHKSKTVAGGAYERPSVHLKGLKSYKNNWKIL